MANTNLRVTFIDEDESLEVDESISLELDDDKNDDATSFAIGANAFVKVMPTGSNSDSFEVNTGTVQKIASNIPQIITNEDVSFVNTATAYLDYIPGGTVSYSWVGKNCGNPTFHKDKITIPNANSGILRCSYTTFFDRLRITYPGPEEASVLLTATRGSSTTSLSIPFEVEGVTGATKDVTITVKDYCNDSVVSYAEITISGTGIATQTVTANAQGQAVFNDLIIGQTYNIKITATDYRDSDVDSLNNDSFTVI